jgi:hypothetical protein
MNAAAARPARSSRCRCQHAVQPYAGGHQRRYAELADLGSEHPVMASVRPAGRRRLPGENPP